MLGSEELNTRILRSMSRRGWTLEHIREAIDTGRAAFPAVDRTAGGAPATRYVHPVTDKSVVVNDQTGRVIHVGVEGCKYD